MKKIIGVLAIYATLTVLAAPAFVNVIGQTTQTPTPAPAAAPAQGACTDDSKAAWYAEFTKFRTTDPTKAYDAGKKYLAACPTEEGQIPAYLKKWVAAYEKEDRKLKLANLFVNQKKYAEALTLAKEILVDEPDNLAAHIYLGYGGYVIAVTTKNESGNAEATGYAKKAIQAIESGKAPENWLPFKSKDDALGYLYYSVGYLNRTNPTDALNNFMKAAQFEGEIKKNPQTYALIAAAYEAEYAKQSADYEAKYKGKDETPESKLAIANINQLVDRIVDALARAVAAAGTDPANQASKTQWLARLTELYKFRHNNSDAGLTEMLASVLSQPLPPAPTPVMTLPDAPATTPASGTTSTGGSTSTTGTPADPAATKTTAPATSSPSTSAPKATPTPSPGAATPTSTPKPPTQPKQRNNHKRH